MAGTRTVQMVSNPFPFNWDYFLAASMVHYFKWIVAIGLRLFKFFYDVCPASAPDAHVSAWLHNTQKIRLTLDQTYRESMHGKDIERFQRPRVIAA